MNKTALLKKVLNVLKKIVKWYLIADVIAWAIIGIKQLKREDIKNDKLFGEWAIKLLKETFDSWKNDEYVN